MDFHVEPSNIRDATVTVPGDKSISHRALMLGSIGTGRTEIGGFLAGEDCLATLQAMRQMGVTIEQHDASSLTVEGVGLHGLVAPASDLDLGNSGTAMRLMAGLLAGQKFSCTLTGDASLSGRPMSRVITPLTAMGAAIESDCDGTPPLQITGGMRLHGIAYAMPVASAQVKSCVLLAGLYAEGATTVTEPAVTRDHTERMLRTMAVPVTSSAGRIALGAARQPQGCAIRVPADLSSAAFIMLAALLSENADILVENVGINPTRTGVIEIFRAMGGAITLENQRAFGDEPVADIRVKSSKLQGGKVDARLVSLAIDEFPAIFVAAAAARGQSTFSGIAELRVKESDRIAAMAAGLKTLGIAVDETDDGAVVHGGTLGGGNVESHGDHRVAMAFAVAGTVARGPVVVRDVAAVETSFPDFADVLADIGVAIALESPA